MNCEKCQIGHYRATTSPYLRWLGDKIMIMPDVPAHTCDICGNTAYDSGFLQKLQLLLDKLISEDHPGYVNTPPNSSGESRSDNPSEGVDTVVS